MTEENKAVETSTAESTPVSKGEAQVNVNTFYGVKAGMTRIFDEQGNHVPVTVIKLVPNKISQVKTKEKDGYEAYQLAYYEKREKLVTMPKQGQLKKAGIAPVFTRFAEVKIEGVDTAALGASVSVEEFTPATFVDVTGTSKGKGFQGVMKRFNFSGGPGAHGSKFHRTTGSIGQRATPGKVWKNKKLPGHMGQQTVTVQNLVVVETNLEKGYMLIRGSVPGSKNEYVKISKAFKK